MPNLWGKIIRERPLRHFRDLKGLIEQTRATEKKRLPLLSFVRFGDLRNEKGVLRRDANAICFGAVPGDHDAGTMQMGEAADLLSAEARIAAILHTTSSNTLDGPRWHVFAPTSEGIAAAGVRRSRRAPERRSASAP